MTSRSRDEFKIGECVGHIANFLEAYNKIVEKKGENFINLHFSKFDPIGDFAKPLSKTLLKLLPEKWEEKWGKDSIYGRLKKAINEDDKATDDKVKTVDDEDLSADNENKSGNDENKAGDNKGKATGSEDFSPIAVDVDGINCLIPIDMRRENTVNFLMDIENWTDLFEKVTSTLDIGVIIAVMTDVYNRLTSGCKIINPENWNNSKELRDLHEAIETLPNSPFSGKFVLTYVARIRSFLIAYKKVDEKDDEFKRLYFTRFTPIGDFAEPLSKALINLVPEKGSVYERLTKAIYEDDKAALNKNKSTDGGNKSGGDAELAEI